MVENSIQIAVVSDLHCRHGKEGQITTHLYTELPRNPKEHHPVEALKQLIKRESLKTDLLLCPGDLTDKADRQGLTTGWDIIKEISKELKSSFYTSSVGNHDVNSREAEGNPFHYITSFKDDFPINDEDLKNFFWSADKNYFVVEKENYIVLNFNSSYNHLDPNRAKKSIITDDIVAKMDEDLKKYNDSAKIKIALFHHHPKPFANVDPAYKDGDLIERGDLLLTKLQKLGFDFVLHGHKHLPRLEYFDSSLPIFCSGSFSSLMNIIDVSGKNTFHIVSITKRNNKAVGTIKTWEFTKGHGWGKATNFFFFPWITGFGFNEHLTDLETKTINFIDERGAALIDFKELLKELNEINYLTPFQQDQFSRSLLKKNIEFVPDLRLGAKFVTKQLE